MRNGTLWTEEQDAQLRKLRDQGLSASQIAAELGGMTRNAVIGRAGRLGLEKQKRGPKTVREQQSKVPQIRRVHLSGLSEDSVVKNILRKRSEPIPVLDSKSDAPVTLFDLEPHHCRWPVQDAPYLFCADTKQDGSSYCSRHFGVSKRVASPR
jgi:GcrA cell cycle regulator